MMSQLAREGIQSAYRISRRVYFAEGNMIRCM